MCLVVMEYDKEGSKVSSKPSTAVFPHKKTKKSSIPVADPAGMQSYVIFERERVDIDLKRVDRDPKSCWVCHFSADIMVM